MEKIIMSEGVASQFKGYLQATYEYLNQCNTAIDDCKLLTALGVENNIAEIKIAIHNQKKDISKISNSVTVYEENIIALDNQHAGDLEGLTDEKSNADIKDSQDSIKSADDSLAVDELPKDDTVIETIDEKIEVNTIDETNHKNDNTIKDDGSTLSTIDQTVNPKDDTIAASNTPIIVQDDDSQSDNSNDDSDKTSTNTSSNNTNSENTQYYSNTTSSSNTNNENTVNATEQKYFEFSTDVNDMIDAGDAFANSKYSLTYYTNFLLYKYDITDEEIAEKIYLAMLEYGKTYSQNHNGENPLLRQNEELIISSIYNIIKEHDDFDINDYPIFKNLA